MISLVRFTQRFFLIECTLYVTGVFCELRGEKITKRREARKAKEALQRE
jgi:hypothetical protein